MYDLWWVIVSFALLCILSFWDIKTQLIPWWGFLSCAVMSISYRIYAGNNELLTLMMACIPGAFFLLVAWITKEKVGVGDGILILEIGIGLGLEKCIYMLMIALLLCFVFSAVGLLLKKSNKNTHIPFVPFLTIGILVIGVCG